MTRVLQPEFLELARKGNVVTGKMKMPEDLGFFRGHFPGAPLLPAVSQIRFVQLAIERALERPLLLKRVGRTKFTARILPGAEIGFRIQYDEKRGEASFLLSEGRKDVSNGRLSFHLETDG